MGLWMAEITREIVITQFIILKLLKIVLVTQHKTTDIYNTSRKKAELELISHIFHEKCQLQMLFILVG